MWSTTIIGPEHRHPVKDAFWAHYRLISLDILEMRFDSQHLNKFWDDFRPYWSLRTHVLGPSLFSLFLTKTWLLPGTNFSRFFFLSPPFPTLFLISFKKSQQICHGKYLLKVESTLSSQGRNPREDHWEASFFCCSLPPLSSKISALGKKSLVGKENQSSNSFKN
jgi:hypothetical protein